VDIKRSNVPSLWTLESAGGCREDEFQWMSLALVGDKKAYSLKIYALITRDVNRVPVNRITGYVTRDRFQLTVTDTRKSNCDLRHLAVGRDTSVDKKQIMIKRYTAVAADGLCQ